MWNSLEKIILLLQHLQEGIKKVSVNQHQELQKLDQIIILLSPAPPVSFKVSITKGPKL